jgi:hypothetical protein
MATEGYRVGRVWINGRHRRAHFWSQSAWDRLAPQHRPQGAVCVAFVWVWIEPEGEGEADDSPPATPDPG